MITEGKWNKYAPKLLKIVHITETTSSGEVILSEKKWRTLKIVSELRFLLYRWGLLV